MKIDYEIAFLIAVFSFVYCCVLVRPEMILHKVYKKLYSVFVNEKEEAHWVFKITMYCEKCVSGQVALWLWLFNNWHEYKHNAVSALCTHAAFVALTIFITYIIKTIDDKHGQ